MFAKGSIILALPLLAGCNPARTSDDGADTSSASAGATDRPTAHDTIAMRDAMPSCSRDQLLGHAPDAKEVADHRQSALPVIRYPFDTRLDGPWTFELTLRVDEQGRVVCYQSRNQWGQAQTLTAQRLAEIRNLHQWRYTPFMVDGNAVAAIVKEAIEEEELPTQHIPLPSAPLDRVRISLERTGCFGMCPAYRVDVHGDGRVVYHGKGYVDVQGMHAYRIPATHVANLVETLRNKGLWSDRTEYRAPITDNPTYMLTLRMGDEEHKIEDYAGRYVGMPLAVADFQREVDQVARTAMWLDLSTETVEQLEAEDFRFDSAEGGKLLARAMANEDVRDNAGLLRVIELGAPLVEPDRLMADALWNRRALLIEPLIKRGVLNRNGKPDQAKVDAAFHNAIASGRLSLVEQLWAVEADQPHPSLIYSDPEDGSSSQHLPVTLLLSRTAWRKEPWDGMAITQWLAARGCDLRASATNGDTLLHIASKAGDVAFVRYLLDQGLDPKARGEYELTPLGSASNEDVALLLLQAGDTPSELAEFRRYAEDNHWKRVIDWLNAHRKNRG